MFKPWLRIFVMLAIRTLAVMMLIEKTIDSRVLVPILFPKNHNKK